MELRPDLSCLWKLLGDACTAVSTVSPNRATVLVPALLAGLDPSTQSHKLNQAQTLKVGERYDHKQALTFSELLIPLLLCQIIHFYHQYTNKLTLNSFNAIRVFLLPLHTQA